MHPRPRWNVLAAVLAALALTVTACGDNGEQTTSDDDPGADDVGYNDADIRFLQGMIPHHEQAVHMAELVPDRTDRPELLSFADDIIALQRAEIEQMQMMLEDAGAADDHDGHEGDDEHDMAGMMTEEQMSELENLEGIEFDLLFLDMMTEHHQGAVDASEEVMEDGQNAEVRALAEEIIAAQQAEIEQMDQWRLEWSGQA